MVVLVDTSPRAQDFFRDSSYRPTEFQDENLNWILFRPYILSDTFDVHFNLVLATGSTDLRALCESVEWLKNAGRPTMKDHLPISDSTLVRKLQSGQGAPTLPVKKLAILLTRIGVQIYPGKSALARAAGMIWQY